MKKLVTEWLKIVAGLLVFAFGVHLTIYANIGLAPWDCLGMGIAKHTPLNYGFAMTAVAVTVLLIDILSEYCYPALPLDLHVLSLPLAFILSQDQTLHCILINY